MYQNNMTFEYSAGGVVIKRDKGTVEVLLCQHSQHHGWVFPKGIIGDTKENEGKEDTAIREVKEECGVDGIIIKPLTPVTYWYKWEGEKRKKTVYYFLMDYVGGDITKHDDEMENVEWLDQEDVSMRLTYPSDKKVWEEAREILADSK
ncbi:MAG: hypothetical protein RLZZ455_1002 [Candidatus Parcubacteria bacterium]|jgi:8-oxo-dGTP pyrophosphatase MutT (NUDIX family)